MLYRCFMPTLKERKRQATRAAILEAGRSLFGKNGFDRTSVDELAGAALVSKFTFYNFFQSKEELLNSLHMEVFEALNLDIAEIMANGAKMSDVFVAQIRKLARWYEANKELTRAFSDNSKLLLPASGCDKQRCISETVTLIELGQKNGEFKNDLNAYDVARYILVLVQGEKREWVEADCSYSLEEKMSDAAKFILSALVQKDKQLQ